MSGEEDLHQKILDSICEQRPAPDGYLRGFNIYEQLRSEGFAVSHYAVDTVLSGLAMSIPGCVRVLRVLECGRRRPQGRGRMGVSDERRRYCGRRRDTG